MGLRDSQQGLRPSQRGDGQMDERNFSPFYKTLSPVRAAALLLSETLQHQRTADLMIPFGDWLVFYGFINSLMQEVGRQKGLK